MALTLEREEMVDDEVSPTVALPSFQQILGALAAIGVVIGARAALLVGVTAAAVLTGFVVTAENPPPNAVWGLGIFCALVAALVFRNPQRAA